MKKKALTITALLGFIVIGALTYRMDSFRIVYPERIGYENFRRYSVFAIPFFQKKTSESFPYDQEFEAIYELPLESVAPLIRPADYSESLFGSIYKTYGYGWLYREKREILEAIYIAYRDTKNLTEAKQQIKALKAILPVKSEELKEDTFTNLDDLRRSVGLKPYLTGSDPDGSINSVTSLRDSTP
jgi:hypothetical protein